MMKKLIGVAVAALAFGPLSAVAATTVDPPEFFTAEQKQPLTAYASELDESELAFVEQVAAVNEKYIGALERTKEKMMKIRAERAATALAAEILRIRLGETKRSPELESAPDNVRKMRGQYDQIIVRLNRLKHTRDTNCRFELDERLEQIQVELTKANKLEQALSVREYREALRNPPEPEEEEETPPAAPDPVEVKDPEPAGDRTPAPAPRPRPMERDEFIDAGEPQPMSAADIKKNASALGPKPQRSAGGYDVMLKSIASGQVTEIKANKIKRWGTVRAMMFDGKPYWSATVSYPSTSMFGTFDTEGMALIRGNRVVHWLYTGSGEAIP
ncbi:MAG: hypothetical protein ACR2RV_05620 [Verrucomicrobiales bacterium]